jgi:hypothetical protein
MIGTKYSLKLEPDDQAGLTEKGVLGFSKGATSSIWSEWQFSRRESVR